MYVVYYIVFRSCLYAYISNIYSSMYTGIARVVCMYVCVDYKLYELTDVYCVGWAPHVDVHM